MAQNYTGVGYMGEGVVGLVAGGLGEGGGRRVCGGFAAIASRQVSGDDCGARNQGGDGIWPGGGGTLPRGIEPLGKGSFGVG